MNCENCGAKWHLNFSRIIYYSNGAYARMHVELKKEAEDGKGKELLGKNLEAPKWKKCFKEFNESKASANIAE